jgi:hypothetical protein
MQREFNRIERKGSQSKNFVSSVFFVVGNAKEINHRERKVPFVVEKCKII